MTRRRFALAFTCAVAMSLSACAPVVTPPENKSVFIDSTDFHITELSRAVVAAKPTDMQPGKSEDLWQVMRDGFKLPVMNTPAVSQQAQRYASGRYHLQPTLDRASLYLFYIVQELRARDMPTEIALIPLIESSYSPIQRGAVHHAGIWGIMPASAKPLGLAQNAFKDERRDILRSTQAALDHLQDLYVLFGDWQLAIIAYNWGSGNVIRVVAKAKSQKISPTYENLALPKAVRDYLIWVAAYKDIIEHPGTYGVTLPPLDNAPYFVVIDVTRDIDISVVLELAQVSKEDFIRLNPSFNKPVIVSAPNQKILLPYKNAEIFQSNLKAYSKPLTTWKQTDAIPLVGKKKR
jgi:membrane-bound lytic murein transglycosylase D